jgi:nitrogenase molybdenum-iron protein beta chain
VSAVTEPRTLCALGAQQSVVAIEGAVPILHAGPGCGYKVHLGLGMFNGFQGGGRCGGAAMPCTNMVERQVVFGGEDRLRTLIEQTLRVMEGDLFAVLTGCTSELVGDDVGGVVREFRDRGVPIVHASTAGFRGTNLAGHETLVHAIVDQLLEPAPAVVPGLVNVWSSVPYQDPFWTGNLAALRALLAGLGLEANVLFGPGSGGLAAWRRVPAAQLNLVVSPWVGVSVARKLEERFGTPWHHQPVLPIGAVETSRFLREVAAATGVDGARAERFIREQERSFHYHFERAADFFLEFRWDLPTRFVTIADSLLGAGVARLLTNEYGLLPARQFVTDDPPAAHREAIATRFRELAPGIGAETTFTSDGEEIRRTLRAEGVTGAILLGSSFDRDIARELSGAHLSISAPMTDRLVCDRSYVGYAGGLRLVEDLYSSILGSVQ